MKSRIGRGMVNERNAAAGYGAHVRAFNGDFASSYEIAKERARLRDQKIAATRAAKEKAA